MRNEPEYRWPPRIPNQKTAEEAWATYGTELKSYADARLKNARITGFLAGIDSSFLSAVLQEGSPGKPHTLNARFVGEYAEWTDEIRATDLVRVVIPSDRALAILKGITPVYRGQIANVLALQGIATFASDETDAPPEPGMFNAWEYGQQFFDDEARDMHCRSLPLQQIYREILTAKKKHEDVHSHETA